MKRYKLLLIILLIIGCDKDNVIGNKIVENNDFETICGMDERGMPTENIGDGICGLCLGQFALEYPYPNPFNPKISISISLPESANISILVSNTQHEIVDTLVNGYMDAYIYTILWDATSFPDGYYRVIADFGGIECFRNIHKKPYP